MGEVDRANQRLATVTVEGEKNAHLAYSNELKGVELEKWNKAANSGFDKINLVASGNKKLQGLKALPVDEIQDYISLETDTFTM